MLTYRLFPLCAYAKLVFKICPKIWTSSIVTAIRSFWARAMLSRFYTYVFMSRTHLCFLGHFYVFQDISLAICSFDQFILYWRLFNPVDQKIFKTKLCLPCVFPILSILSILSILLLVLLIDVSSIFFWSSICKKWHKICYRKLANFSVIR